MRWGCRGAFTLIELIVVVAIVALLVGLLLPTIRGVRSAAQLAQSLSQMRQITIGAAEYAGDNRGIWPMIAAREGRMSRRGEQYNFTSSSGFTFTATDFGSPRYCSWMFGGKTTSAYWEARSRHYSGGLHEKAGGTNPIPGGIAAAEDAGFAGFGPPHRYLGLNAYLDPELYDYYEARTLPRLQGEDARRELPVFQCPADVSTFQRNYNQLASSPPEEVRDRSISTYDDVGTSYQINLSWLAQMEARYPPEWFAENNIPWPDNVSHSELVYAMGLKRFQNGARTLPQFVWLKDEVADIIIRYAWDMDGMHGGSNRAKMAFFDGSARYVECIPGDTFTATYAMGFLDALEVVDPDERESYPQIP